MHHTRRLTHEKHTPTSVLVTGAAGFIGSHVCHSLLTQGYRVYAADNFITGSRANIEPFLTNDRFVFFEIDIANPTFTTLFDTAPIEYVYHLACPTGVPNLRVLAAEMLMTCSYGVFNVLEVARRHRAKVLLSSTAEVYGQPEKFPQDEQYSGNVNPLGERSAYEEGKRFSEAVLAMYVRKYGLDARIVRVFNTYGPGMSLNDARVIPNFLRSILHREPLTVYGNGEQTRSHLYVDDLVAGLQIVMRKGAAGEAFNVGSEHPLTVRALAELVITLTEHKDGIVYEPHFIEDHKDRLPSVEKVKRLGWKQRVPIRDGLTTMIDAYLKQDTQGPALAKKTTTPA